MYKKQMGFQKIACMAALISAAVVFVYSLGILTDLYDTLYGTMRNPNDLTQTLVPGSIIYYDMQDFNRTYMHLGLGLILLAVLLFVTNTHVRRRYYVGNIVATLLFCAASAGVNLWAHAKIAAYKVQYLTTVDFEALKSYAEMWKQTYSDSTLLLDLHIPVTVLSFLAVAALVVNLIWKLNMMRSEAKLIAQGKGAAA